MAGGAQGRLGVRQKTLGEVQGLRPGGAMKPKDSILSYWYTALTSPYGIELVCSDTTKVTQALYRARAEVKDEDLSKISICQSPFDPMKLWLIRREPTNAAD